MFKFATYLRQLLVLAHSRAVSIFGPSLLQTELRNGLNMVNGRYAVKQAKNLVVRRRNWKILTVSTPLAVKNTCNREKFHS